MMLRVDNDGQRVRATNYWSTEAGLLGYCYLTLNAGALRLLVPASTARGLPDLSAAHRVSAQIIDAKTPGAMHLVWEDGTPSPPYLTLDARQSDRVLPRTDLNRQVVLIAYVPGDGPDSVRQLGQWPAVLRKAGLLPV